MRTPTMTQVASLRSGTVHIAVNSAGAVACRPNGQTDGEWTDVQVNCRNCLRIVAEAEREAHKAAELLAQAIADAERVDASASGNSYQSVGTEDLERQVVRHRLAVRGHLRWGQVTKAANFAYVLRMAELELGRRTELQRRNEAIAKGRADAVRHGQDTPMFNTSVVDFAKLAQRLEEHRAEMAQWLAVQAPLQAAELWALGYAAFDHQRNLDTLHLRVIGQCPGCARAAGEGWTHAPGCPAGHLGGVPAFTSAEGMKAFWMRPADPRGLLVPSC